MLSNSSLGALEKYESRQAQFGDAAARRLHSLDVRRDDFSARFLAFEKRAAGLGDSALDALLDEFFEPKYRSRGRALFLSRG